MIAEAFWLYIKLRLWTCLFIIFFQLTIDSIALANYSDAIYGGRRARVGHEKLVFIKGGFDLQKVFGLLLLNRKNIDCLSSDTKEKLTSIFVNSYDLLNRVEYHNKHTILRNNARVPLLEEKIKALLPILKEEVYVILKGSTSLSDFSLSWLASYEEFLAQRHPTAILYTTKTLQQSNRSNIAPKPDKELLIDQYNAYKVKNHIAEIKGLLYQMLRDIESDQNLGEKWSSTIQTFSHNGFLTISEKIANSSVLTFKDFREIDKLFQQLITAEVKILRNKAKSDRMIFALFLVFLERERNLLEDMFWALPGEAIALFAPGHYILTEAGKKEMGRDASDYMKQHLGMFFQQNLEKVDAGSTLRTEIARMILNKSVLTFQIEKYLHNKFRLDPKNEELAKLYQEGKLVEAKRLLRSGKIARIDVHDLYSLLSSKLVNFNKHYDPGAINVAKSKPKNARNPELLVQEFTKFAFQDERLIQFKIMMDMHHILEYKDKAFLLNLLVLGLEEDPKLRKKMLEYIKAKLG